jgi:hypothetical protein
MNKILLVLIFTAANSFELTDHEKNKGRACYKILKDMIPHAKTRIEQTEGIDKEKALKLFSTHSLRTCCERISYDEAYKIIRIFQFFSWKNYNHLMNISPDLYLNPNSTVSSDELDFFNEIEREFIRAYEKDSEYVKRERKFSRPPRPLKKKDDI